MDKQFIGAVLALVLAATAAVAQQPPTERVAGTVESFDGHMLAVKTDKLGEVKVSLADKTAVWGVTKATVTDIKPGDYIGVGATPQPDNSQRAIQIVIFAEQQRGVGEGHRPWDRPNSTMTNGAVDQTVTSVDGPVLMVKYKGGEQKIVVPPDAVIRAYVTGDKSDLKPGAQVAVVRATKKPDGSFEANRVNVGRDGVVP
jgi:hypothetical protein